MGIITVMENATLDGVIEQLGDWFSPAGSDAETDSADIVATLREQIRAQSALLLGRKTFESFRRLLAGPDRRHHRHKGTT